MANVPDGTFDFLGGQNQAVNADLIGANQFAGGVNLTTVNGLKTRPKFIERQIKVVTEGGIPEFSGKIISYQKIFKQGKFQFQCRYATSFGDYAIIVISGVIFRLNIKNFEADVLSETIRANEFSERLNGGVAGRFIVIFDYPDFPIIIDQSTVRRANPDATNSAGVPFPEIPVSNIGIYNQARLIVGNNANEIGASDPVGPGFPNAPISFQTSLIPGAPYYGQYWQVGATQTTENISYLGTLQLVDTSTGIGPLIVGTESAVYSYRTDLPRASWEGTTFGSIMLSSTGIGGPKAGVNVNQDFFFLGSDGQLRSINMSRQDQGSWKSTPISREVKSYLIYSDLDLVRFSVLAYFNNRLFITCNPVRTVCKTLGGLETIDRAFKGLIVLEMANTAGLFQQANPAYAGLWTGIYPMDMMTFNKQFFIIAKDGLEVNSIYELVEDAEFDVIGNKKQRVRSRLYTRGYSANDNVNDKELINFELELNQFDVRNGFKIKSYTRSGHQDNFVYHSDFQTKADKDARCTLNFIPSGLKSLNFGGTSKVDCDKVTKKSNSIFKKLQIMLEFIGNFQLEGIQLNLKILQDVARPTIPCKLEATELNRLDCSFINDFDFYSTANFINNEEDEKWLNDTTQ